MSATIITDPRTGDAFVAAVVTRDYDAISTCLDPEVRFRALTPGDVFGSYGPQGVTSAYRHWFGDADSVVPLSSHVESVSDRLRLSYQLEIFENGKRSICEQQAYATVQNGVVSDLTVICSGFSPWVG